MTSLIKATDDHFEWLLGGAGHESLKQAPGGVDDIGVLALLRSMTARLHGAGCSASWLIADGREIVGLCSFKRPPDEKGWAEIGYGVAASRRGRGYATEAVRLLVAEVAENGWASSLVAETGMDNVASQRVLSANGFDQVEARTDEEGEVIVWTCRLA
jgi:RimJ/RimL family protein N-acetyltransferase